MTNPVTRHPTVTASAVGTLYQQTDGRAMLGISTGDSTVFIIGQHPARLTELEETVSVCKALWRGKTVTYEGEPLQLTWLREDVSASTTDVPSPTEDV